MSEEINKIFEQWKKFLYWCYENNDKTAEIHRDNLERVMAYTRQLENIIKEVREYIKENCIDDEFYINLSNKEKHIIGALQILDKENRNGSN